MKLPWRAVHPGPAVSTSLTPSEAQELRRLARGRRCLDVGSALGYSAVQMAFGGAESVLTVDHHRHIPNSERVLRENLSYYRLNGIIEVAVADSRDFLPSLPSGSFGLVFVDGGHDSETVLHDAREALRLAAEGGVVAFHDYGEDTCPDVKTALNSMGLRGQLIDTLLLCSR